MKFSPDKLWEIERLLNEYSFDGIEIGGLLAMDLQLGLNSGQYLRRVGIIPPIVKTLVSVFRKPFAKMTKEEKVDIVKFKGRPIITFITNREELFPISGNFLKYSKFDFLSFLLHEGVKDRLDSLGNKYDYVLMSCQPGVSLSTKIEIWIFVYIKLKVLWLKCRQKFGLDNIVLDRFRESLFFHLVLSKRYKYFLENYRPKFILTEYDRYGTVAPLVLQARLLGIPSFSLMHGVINNSFGYLPVLADKLFVWGELQKALLTKYTNDSSKILVGGASQFSMPKFCKRNEVLENLNLEISKKYVTFGSSNVPEPFRSLAMQEFCEAAKKNSNPGIKFLVKLHPAEPIQYYSQYFKDNTEIKILPKVGLSKMEFFSFCDILVVYCSALGFDAILNDCPLIVINVGEASLGNSRQFINEAGIPECLESSQLLEQISLSIEGEISEQTKNFKINYCAKIGREAVENMDDLINTILHERSV